MRLKGPVVTYLCLFLAFPCQAATNRYRESAPPPEPYGYSDGISRPNSARAAGPLLGSASEYASGFESGDSPLDPSSSASFSGILAPGREDSTPPARGAEYVSGYYKGAVLMPVRLWGAVKQTGLHRVPTGTDLMQLITLAGGPSSDAKLESVTIKRVTKKGPEVIKVDLLALIESSSARAPELLPNDVVVLPVSKPFFTTDTVTLVGIVTAVASVALSTVLIADKLGSKK